MKTPTHISSCIKSSVLECNGSLLNCDIACLCGNQVFQLLYPGATHLYQGKKIPCTLQTDDSFFFLIRAKCIICGRGHVLFDKDFHGWDGFVCHDVKEASKTRPSLVPWKCIKCGKLEHSVQIQFCYGGEDEMIEDLADFPIENLADAFQWIYIDITCESCGLVTKKWVDYETA